MCVQVLCYNEEKEVVEMRVLWLIISILSVGLIVLNWNTRRKLVTGLRKDQRRYIDKCKGFRWKFIVWGFWSVSGLVFFFFR